MAYEATYHEDSDADDEYERSVASPTLPLEYSSSPTESDPPSTEHTPTTYTHSTANAVSPRGLITSWSAEQCADFVSSLGLDKYRDSIIREDINGEALVECQQSELKDVGITSVGHRLTILKGVYEVKLKQNIPIETDDYVPLSADANAPDGHATQDDLVRIVNQIKLRDDRIKEAEAELRAIRDDLYRITEEQKKTREETLPLVRMAKDRTHPLPTPDGVDQHHTIPSPGLNQRDQDQPKSGGGIVRKISKKGLFSGAGSNTKMPSPTIHEEPGPLESSAAATAASNHLTSSFHSSQGSPHMSQQPSPTSPPYNLQQYPGARGFPRPGGADSSRHDGTETITPWTHHPNSSTISTNQERSNTSQTAFANTPGPNSNPPTGRRPVVNTSNSTPPSATNPNANPSDSARTPNPNNATTPVVPNAPGGTPGESDPGGFMKSFRVSMEEPCHKVLPVALKKYQIQDDWRQYSLYIVHGDQERCLGLEERPLILFKQLANEGKKPMFMLRKHAAPEYGYSGVRESNASESQRTMVGSGSYTSAAGLGVNGASAAPNWAGGAGPASLNIPGLQRENGRIQSYTSGVQLPGGVL